MAFSRPTLNQLQQRIAADISGRLLNGAPLRKASVLNVLAWVFAGACHIMYGFFAWLTMQAMPHTSEAEFLAGWAAVWDVQRKPASVASGTVLVSGASGAIVPAFSQLKHENGQFYQTLEDARLDDSSASVAVEAISAGVAANLAAGQTLTFVESLAFVQSNCLVETMSNGTDEESDERLRERLLLLIRKPPHGGNADDYVQWALEISGVTRAWCLPLYAGPGTVGVTFVCDDEQDFIPTPQKVREVYEHILSQCPVTARPGLIVFAPEILAVDIEMSLTPDTLAVRQAVEAELADMFEGAAPGQKIYLSHINAAISNAPGELDHVLLAPTANINPAAHELPTLGVITYG